MQILDAQEAMRNAGMCCNFMWQDECAKGYCEPSEVDYTSVLGTLPKEVNGSPVFLVLCEGTSYSAFGYNYPVNETLTVRLDNGTPVVARATEAEIHLMELHNRDLACEEYAQAMDSNGENEDSE